MQLSILIPSIPSRFYKATKTYKKILSMVGDKEIEVLMLTDNKVSSIGAKREHLKNISTGKYFMFCDDDDSLLSLDEIYEATFKEVDVISFKAECLNNDRSTFIVTMGLGNEVEHNCEDGRYLDCKRPPFHICAWNKWYKRFSFPDISYSEDWEWLKQCLPHAQREVYIGKVLFKYNFNPKKTEASTETNEYWTNPNESNSEPCESAGELQDGSCEAN